MKNMKFKFSCTTLALAALALGGCGSVLSPVGPPPGVTTAGTAGGPDVYTTNGNVGVVPPASALPTLIDNFEDQNMTDALGLPIESGFNAANCNITIGFRPAPPVGSFFWDTTLSSVSSPPGGSPLPGGTVGSAIRMSGAMGANVGPNWPYAEMSFGINTAGADVNALAPTKKFVFHYKAGVVPTGGAQYRVFFVDKTIVDYSWYDYKWTPTNTNWNAITVNLPVTGCTPYPACVPSPKFAQATWGSPQRPWAAISTNITRVVFSPFSGGSSTMNYDLTIDDVRFQ